MPGDGVGMVTGCTCTFKLILTLQVLEQFMRQLLNHLLRIQIIAFQPLILLKRQQQKLISIMARLYGTLTRPQLMQRNGLLWDGLKIHQKILISTILHMNQQIETQVQASQIQAVTHQVKQMEKVEKFLIAIRHIIHQTHFQ